MGSKATIQMDALNTIVRRVEDLATEEWDEDEIPPSASAIERTVAFLTEASQLSDLPIGYASTTGAGDVRVYWHTGVNAVHFVMRQDPDDIPYLYVRDKDTDEYIVPASPSSLSNSLQKYVAANGQ